MGVKQSIIDWLESVPGPTEAQARRWRRVRWGLVGLAVLAEILLWYVLYRMDVNDPPLWLNVPANWLLQHVPAAQGYTNLAFALREEMPYVFMIGFLFSHVVAAAILLFDHDRVAFLSLSRVLRFRLGRAFFYLVSAELAFGILVYLKVYGFESELTVDGQRTYLANINESPLALMVVHLLFYGFLGAVLGQHLAFLRDFAFHAARRRSL